AGYNLYAGYREGADGAFDMAAAEELLNAYMAVNIPRLQRDSEARITKNEIQRHLQRELVTYKLPDFPNHVPDGTYDLDNVLSDVWMHDWGRDRAWEFIRSHPWAAPGWRPSSSCSSGT